MMNTFFSKWIACECNGWSGRCRYVEDLYTQTGDGGECLDCDGNRAGQHCEICKENHYLAKQPDAQGRIPCVDCMCDTTGNPYFLKIYMSLILWFYKVSNS